MPRPSITAEKRAEMRAHVREALLRVARKRGFAMSDSRAWSKITIRDVIKEADISIGTFYKYFEDRADLASTLWVEPVNTLRNALQAAFDEASDPPERVRVLLEGYARFGLENSRFYKNVFMLVRPEDQPVERTMALTDESFYSNLVEAFEEGQRQGCFRPFDTHIMAQLFWSAVHGSLALPLNLYRFKLDSSETLSTHMIEQLLAMISAHSS